MSDLAVTAATYAKLCADQREEIYRLRAALAEAQRDATPPADAALADQLDARAKSRVSNYDAELMRKAAAAIRARQPAQAVAVPEGFVPIPPGIQSVDRDFEYDASTGMHIPKVVVRLTPGKDTDAQTWNGRDKLVWSITQAARALLAASKGGAA